VAKSNRFWEIDTFRGIAIIMMIIYHIIFDLFYFEIYDKNLSSLPLRFFLYSIGIMFLVIVGISLHISYSKARQNLTEKQLKIKFIRRGSMIFGLGILITIATWVYPHEGFILFGILHCIGLSIILAYPFLKMYVKNLILGVIFIIAGIFLMQFTFGFNYLLFLGFVPDNFYTLDFFPLLPWFGMVLIGIFIGKYLYKDDKRRFSLSDLSNKSLIKGLSFLGRHSLLIYLVHQPIIVGFILLFLKL
jgi:uncharacterized membrane protein